LIRTSRPTKVAPHERASSRALLPVLLGALLLNGAAVLWGQSPVPSSPSPAASLAGSTSPVPDWANRGHWNFGAQIGFALENAIPRNVSHIGLLIVQPQLGFIVLDAPASRFPVRRFEIVNEGIFGNAIHPGGRLTGYALLFRLDGKPRGHFIPFFDLGGGMQHTTLYTRAPELTGGIQFSPQAGLGVQYFFNPQRALVLEYRYMHMSNADIERPNLGFNASMLSVGFRWLRRPRPAAWRTTSRRSHNPFHFLFGAD
jgi:hypothetical protein